MERAELEKLMDKYKAEALEYGKKNGRPYATKNEGAGPLDEAERKMSEAIKRREVYTRDRSDPLPEKTGTEPESEADNPEKNAENEAASALAPVSENGILKAEEESSATEYLKKICERIDADSESTEEQKTRCKDVEEFLAYNEEFGTIRVETFAGDRAFGVVSARVMIFLPLESGNITIFDGLTNVNGTTKNVLLPAPPRALSQAPQNSDSKRKPYSVYTIYVEHPLYVGAAFTNVPVFSGVESIQPVRMLAKSVGSQEPGAIVVDQSNQNQL